MYLIPTRLCVPCHARLSVVLVTIHSLQAHGSCQLVAMSRQAELLAFEPLHNPNCDIAPKSDLSHVADSSAVTNQLLIRKPRFWAFIGQNAETARSDRKPARRTAKNWRTSSSEERSHFHSADRIRTTTLPSLRSLSRLRGTTQHDHRSARRHVARHVRRHGARPATLSPLRPGVNGDVLLILTFSMCCE